MGLDEEEEGGMEEEEEEEQMNTVMMPDVYKPHLPRELDGQTLDGCVHDTTTLPPLYHHSTTTL